MEHFLEIFLKILKRSFQYFLENLDEMLLIIVSWSYTNANMYIVITITRPQWAKVCWYLSIRSELQTNFDQISTS